MWWNVRFLSWMCSRQIYSNCVMSTRTRISEDSPPWICAVKKGVQPGTSNVFIIKYLWSACSNPNKVFSCPNLFFCSLCIYEDVIPLWSVWGMKKWLFPTFLGHLTSFFSRYRLAQPIACSVKSNLCRQSLNALWTFALTDTYMFVKTQKRLVSLCL